ncbi:MULTISPECIES: hypothetical protein [Amycolatopsis]|uniref:DUF3558 domain-containing protein n=1 Tax=Amycolatopsis albidoflavus TaxID=102226 RepID=A0ABW5IDU3_9PSEU
MTAAPPLPPRPKRKKSHLALWTGIGVATALTALLVTWATVGTGALLWGAAHDKAPDPTPDKYHETNFATCAGFAARAPEIPQAAFEIVRSWQPEISKDGSVLCSFTPAAQRLPELRLAANWYAKTDRQSGRESAQLNFTGSSALSKDDSPVGLPFGEKAHWLPGMNPRDCELIVLDHNATFQVGYTPASPNGGSESCRGELRKLAEALYTTAQPR